MKKLVLFAVVLGAVSFTSCKKNYTCTYPDGEVVTYEDPSDLLLTSYEAACELGGGKWEKE